MLRFSQHKRMLKLRGITRFERQEAMAIEGKNALCIDADGSTRMEHHDNIPQGVFLIAIDEAATEFKVRLPHPDGSGAKYMLHLNTGFGEVLKYEAVSDQPEVSGVHKIRDDCVDAINRRLATLRERRAELQPNPNRYCWEINYLNERIIELKELMAELVGRQNAA